MAFHQYFIYGRKRVCALYISLITSASGNAFWFVLIYKIEVSSVVILSLLQRLFILLYSEIKIKEKCLIFRCFYR